MTGSPPEPNAAPTFVSRAGHKLAAALDAFALDVRETVCADFGCNVGGFTDCLLRRGAARVYAVDTGYGELAWSLRRDERVVVMERTNALHWEAPAQVDLVTVDAAWTPQRLIVPAAVGWLGPRGRIVSLLKPHYELAKLRGRRGRSKLPDAEAAGICRTVCEELAQAGHPPAAAMRSPLRGKGGNAEFVLLFNVSRGYI